MWNFHVIGARYTDIQMTEVREMALCHSTIGLCSLCSSRSHMVLVKLSECRISSRRRRSLFIFPERGWMMKSTKLSFSSYFFSLFVVAPVVVYMYVCDSGIMWRWVRPIFLYTYIIASLKSNARLQYYRFGEKIF